MLGPEKDRPMRFLLCGDEPATLAIIRNRLGDRHHLEVASRSEEFLTALHAQPRGFDLLLLDTSMPDTDVARLVDAIKRGELGQEPPVVLLAQDAQIADSPGWIGCPASEVIPKPTLGDDGDSFRRLVERHGRLSRSNGKGTGEGLGSKAA